MLQAVSKYVVKDPSVFIPFIRGESPMWLGRVEAWEQTGVGSSVFSMADQRKRSALVRPASRLSSLTLEVIQERTMVFPRRQLTVASANHSAGCSSQGDEAISVLQRTAWHREASSVVSSFEQSLSFMFLLAPHRSAGVSGWAGLSEER